MTVDGPSLVKWSGHMPPFFTVSTAVNQKFNSGYVILISAISLLLMNILDQVHSHISCPGMNVQHIVISLL
jgi:hypothetical protein